jgi:death-on-curing protein
MSLVYLTLEQAIETHAKTVEVSGGGALGHLDVERLGSCLEHIQNDEYYPTFEEKLTHIFFCANKFHCFQDGNKRIAISVGAQFLLINGYVFVVKRFIHEMENISYHVAAGRIDKDFLKEIITAVINDEMDDETLKLKILLAISHE